MDAASTYGVTAHDHDLVRRIVNFLHTCGIGVVGKLSLDADRGVVVMRGQLSSEREKWLCLACCQRVGGVIRVVDELQVMAA